MTDNISQQVFLLPESGVQKYAVIHLKHPRTNSPALCAIDSNYKLYEVVHYADEFSSWFIADSVSEDGRLFLLSAVDPLFFVLPYVNKNEKFCRLEDLFVDEHFPDLHHLLKSCKEDELLNIFDFKESSGFKVYCYNNTKALHWLQKKVKYLSNTLKLKNIDTADGSKSSALQLDIENKDPKELLAYSCHLISEYLPEDLYEELMKCLGIERQSKKKLDNGPQEKSKKQNTSVDPIDDYSKKYPINNSQEKQKSKLTSAQKKLQKVDKKGMKSISSFFQKK